MRIATIVASSSSPRTMPRCSTAKPIDIVERLQLFADIRFPPAQIEPRADERKQPCGVDVADDLECVLRPVGQLVDVDEQRVHLPGRVSVMTPQQHVVPTRSFCTSGRCLPAHCRAARRNSGIAGAVSWRIRQSRPLPACLRAYGTRMPRSRWESPGRQPGTRSGAAGFRRAPDG